MNKNIFVFTLLTMACSNAFADISGSFKVLKSGGIEVADAGIETFPEDKQHITIGDNQFLSTSADLIKDVQKPKTVTPEVIKHASFDWAAANNADAESIVGDDGSVTYPYGASQPVVACSPLHLCSIKLQEDEHITNISIGDSVRWKVQSATAGKYPVLVIKPTTDNLKTNLIAMTDAGRVYYMTLVSSKNKWIPIISFYDPQKLVEVVTQSEAEKLRIETESDKKKADATIASIPGDDITSMDFDWAMSGSSEIKPIRIFSSNGHTYIQMVDSMRFKDAPAIFSVINGEQQLVNYKTKGAYYIVDSVPEKINLVLGAGSNAKTVTITHKQK